MLLINLTFCREKNPNIHTVNPDKSSQLKANIRTLSVSAVSVQRSQIAFVLCWLQKHSI